MKPLQYERTELAEHILNEFSIESADFKICLFILHFNLTTISHLSVEIRNRSINFTHSSLVFTARQNSRIRVAPANDDLFYKGHKYIEE